MKKIFTLIAVAFVALSVNAKEAIDFTKIEGFQYGTSFTLGGWDWKGVTLSQGEPVKNEEAKTADDSSVIYYDGSAWDYVVVKYSASTADISLIAQYKCLGTIGQYGVEYAQASATINKSETGGYAALQLDEAQKKTINQIAIQGGQGGGSITIEEVYFATTAEWEAVKPEPAQTKDVDFGSLSGTTNADGSKTLTGATAYSWFGIWLGGFDASEFDYLVVEVDPSSEVGTQVLVQYGNGATDGDTSKGVVNAGESLLMVPLNASFKNAVNQIGIQNVAPGSLTIKKVYFATQKYIDELVGPALEYETEGKSISISDGGNILASEFAGYSDDAKVVFITTVTGSDGYVGWGNGSITSIGGAVPVGSLTVAGEGANETVFLLSQLKEALDAPGFYKDEETGEEVATDSGLYWNVWGFDDGKCTSTRTSVTIYEVVGFSGEGYVPAGINTVSAEQTKSNAIYNLAGQKVNAQYKGVVIKNGKKVMQ